MVKLKKVTKVMYGEKLYHMAHKTRCLRHLPLTPLLVKQIENVNQQSKPVLGSEMGL